LLLDLAVRVNNQALELVTDRDEEAVLDDRGHLPIVLDFVAEVASSVLDVTLLVHEAEAELKTAFGVHEEE